jgi:hypothetical protein
MGSQTAPEQHRAKQQVPAPTKHQHAAKELGTNLWAKFVAHPTGEGDNEDGSTKRKQRVSAQAPLHVCNASMQRNLSGNPLWQYQPTKWLQSVYVIRCTSLP